MMTARSTKGQAGTIVVVAAGTAREDVESNLLSIAAEASDDAASGASVGTVASAPALGQGFKYPSVQ